MRRSGKKHERSRIQKPSKAGIPRARSSAAGVYIAAAAVIILALRHLYTFPAYTLNLLMQSLNLGDRGAGAYHRAGLQRANQLGAGGVFRYRRLRGGSRHHELRPAILACVLLAWVVAAAVAGAALGLMSLRLGGHYLAMVTISFQTILSLVLTNWVEFTHGPDGISGIRRPSHFVEQRSLSGSLHRRYSTLVGYLVWWLRRTKLGRAMQATRDNELAAGVVGVDTYQHKVIAFTLSAICWEGSAADFLPAAFPTSVPDQFSFSESVVFLTMALLGGSRLPFGTVFGTGLLIMLPEWLRFLKIIYLAVYGGAVILIMVFMPDGIFGYRRGSGGTASRQPGTAGEIPPLALGQQAGHDERRAMLKMTGLAKHFGGVKAVDGVDMAVQRNTVHALIGPNGSGKTTLAQRAERNLPSNRRATLNSMAWRSLISSPHSVPATVSAAPSRTSACSPI